MDREGLINSVKSRIDELTASGEPLIVDVGLEDDKPIDVIIEALLDESAKEVLLKAPTHRLKVSSYDVSAIADVSKNYTGTIVLPSDFVRLVEFKMSEWDRPATELYPVGSSIAQRQSNKWLRAKTSKPVAVLSTRAIGDVSGITVSPVIEYYSVNSSHAVSRFLYIKTDVAENISEWLQDALTWICASKVLTIFGKTGEAKLALDNAVGFLIN